MSDAHPKPPPKPLAPPERALIRRAPPAVIKAWTIDEDLLSIPAGAAPSLDDIEASLPPGWIRVGDAFVNLNEVIALRLGDGA